MSEFHLIIQLLICIQNIIVFIIYSNCDDRGVWVFSPGKFVVIFIQSGAILAKLMGTCSWILCHKKEGMLAILKHIFEQICTVYSDMCLHSSITCVSVGIQSKIKVGSPFFRIKCEPSERENYLRILSVASKASRIFVFLNCYFSSNVEVRLFIFFPEEERLLIFSIFKVRLFISKKVPAPPPLQSQMVVPLDTSRSKLRNHVHSNDQKSFAKNVSDGFGKYWSVLISIFDFLTLTWTSICNVYIKIFWLDMYLLFILLLYLHCVQ